MYQQTERRPRRGDEDESYFVSLSDLMAGVLFLFIIMLTYFGLELQKTADAVGGRHAVVEHLKLDAPKPPPGPPPPALKVPSAPAPRDPRVDLMERLGASLRAQHAPVEIDVEGGALRFPDRVIFDATGALTPAGRAAMAATAEAFRRTLPCYAYAAALPRPADCPKAPGRIGALFIEGHTGGSDAWGLSIREVAAAFAALSAAQPALPTLTSRPDGGQPILNIGGYGASRPVATNEGGDAGQNARLEMRIVMAALD